MVTKTGAREKHFELKAIPRNFGVKNRKRAIFLRSAGKLINGYDPKGERELARFFLLSLIKRGKGVPMFSDKLDAHWHDLILDTRFYADFCEKAFGFFLHHIPRNSRIRPSRSEREMKPAEFAALYEKVFGEAPDTSIWNHLNSYGYSDCKSCCPCCSA